MKRDVFWSGLEASIAAFLSLIGSFAIARIIGASELGIGAAAVAVHVVLWVAVNALFADAIVQMPSVNERTLSSAFWASSGIGCLAGLIQAGLGFALADVLVDPRLLAMSVALAVPLPFVGAGGVIQGLLTRERAYKQLALRTLIGQGVGTSVGLVTAMTGAGGWSLVLQQTTTSFLGALALFLGRGWTPAFCIEVAAIRALLRIGLPLAASTLVLIARYRVFAILIGGSAGPAVLGQVHIAFRLVDTVKELTFTALWRLMLPRMATNQNNLNDMLTQVDRWTRWCAVGLLPPCAVMAVALPPTVSFLLGPSWSVSGQAATLLVGLMAWSIVTFPASVALVAAGGVKQTLIGNLISLLLGSIATCLIPPADAWHAVTIWVASQLAVAPYNLWVNARALGVELLRPLSGGFRFPRLAR